MRYIPISIALICCVATQATAQNPPTVVQARMVLSVDGAHPGSTIKAAVVAKIAPGYHINDHKPTLDYLIPTELKLEPAKQVEVGELNYPKGRLQKLAFSDTPLSVYEGEIIVGAMLKVGASAPAGSYPLKGKFAYQACNDHACLPPTSVPVAVTVKVVERSVPVKRVNADVFGKSEPN